MKEIEDQGAVISSIRQSMQVSNPELYKVFFETVDKEFPKESYKLVFLDDLELETNNNEKSKSNN